MLENCYGIALQPLTQFRSSISIIITGQETGPYFGWSTTTVQESFSLGGPGSRRSHGPPLQAVVGIMNRGKVPVFRRLIGEKNI